MSAAPQVDVRNLRRVFDVSKPWLNRVLEGGHLEFLKAVDGVTFDIARGETFALALFTMTCSTSRNTFICISISEYIFACIILGLI